jgi:uncharacterized protein
MEQAMTREALSYPDFNSSGSVNPTLSSIVDERFARRHFLNGGFKLSAAGALSASGLLGCGSSTDTSAATTPVELKLTDLQFKAVPKSLADSLVVAPGYNAKVILALGDPITSTAAPYANNGTDSAASFEQRIGDHHDGMHFFGAGANNQFDPTVSDRGLLALNHEALTTTFLHPTGQTILGTGTSAKRTIADEVIREMNAMGVSVVEVNRQGNSWSYNRSALLNRRITTSTVMELSGPAAGTAFMKTRFAPDGKTTRGTANNCASGYTPWGTYLTCEENWAGYFRRIETTDNPKRSAKEITALNRYGVRGVGRELWATVTPDTADSLFGRWNAEKTGTSADGSDDFRNAPNTFGWVVEIDPFNRASVPKKRTALGRFAHEGAWLGPVQVGQPLVWYMGCDSRNEYIYKYVSSAVWSEADSGKGLQAGDKYMDSGKCYVAKFNADGTGQWLELTFGVGSLTPANPIYPFENQPDVLTHMRLAADAVGATKMDRPEWGAVNPINGEVYFTLTNTNATARPIDKIDAANPRFYNDARANGVAQTGNANGHIVRFAETDRLVTAMTFKWDIYLFGSRDSASKETVNLSGLVADNDFSSPDGLWFSRATPGLLWIQTDDGAYTDVTNCMLLAAIPGSVGDGNRMTVNSADGATTKSVDTFVGAAASPTTLKRFLVGPKDCEITGLAESPDGRS